MSDARLSIAIADILVPKDRLRPVDEGAALALSRLIQQEGQKSPIAVYRSNASIRPYTLIYGARRLRALEILGAVEIEAVLRMKAEARMLEITDNLVMPALDALEQAEFVTAYRHWWETEYGPVERGGDQKSNGHRGRLIRDLNLSEKPIFYKDLEDKFGISERTARRLFSVGRLHPVLRNAIRGTRYAREYKYLAKLTKFRDTEQQWRIAVAFQHHPDLEAVLRIGDPEASREGVGRMETQDWRESQFLDGWKGMTPERRAVALEKLGLMARPLNPWPADLPEIRAVPAAGNNSPLRDMLRDPYARLSRKLTYEQVMRLKAQYEEEARELERHLKGVQANIEEQEKQRQAEFAAQRERAKAKAARALRMKTGASIELPAREKNMLGELDEGLRRALSESRGERRADLVRACHKLDNARQVALVDILYQGCDLELAEDYADELLIDQRSRPRGAARRDVTMPLLVARKGPEKGMLPQLWKRIKARKLEGVIGGGKRGILDTLTAERQLLVCDILDREAPLGWIRLYSRKLSSNNSIRHRFNTDVLIGRIAPEEIPEWLNHIDFEATPERQVSSAQETRARRRKRGPGRPALTVEGKFIKKLIRDGVSAELADRLVNVLKADKTYWIAQEAHKLTSEQQQELIIRIDNGTDLEDAAYTIMKMLEGPGELEYSVKALLKDLQAREEPPTRH